MQEQQKQFVTIFESDKELNRTLMNNFGSVIVFFFFSENKPQTTEQLNQLNNLIPVLGEFDNVKYFAASAERCPETFNKFGVQQTPFIVFTQTDKKVLFSQVVEDLGQIFDTLSRVSEEHKQNFAKEQAIWHPKVKSIIESSPFIAFIKGTPEEPKCGFTRTLLEIFKNHQIEYTYYDIIADEQMRYWARHYTQWPTYPQIFIKGKLIGGLDKLKELVESGEFAKMIPASCKVSTPEQRYNNFIQEHETVLFISGFTFENADSAKALEAAKQKYGDVAIYNVDIDKSFKEYITGTLKQTLPFVVHQKNVVAL